MSARSSSSAPSGTPMADSSSVVSASGAWPSGEELLTILLLPRAAAVPRESPAASASGRSDYLAPVVHAAGRARGVRELVLAAVRAGHQLGQAGLPLRPARPGIATRLLPLRYRHVWAPSLVPARVPSGLYV